MNYIRSGVQRGIIVRNSLSTLTSAKRGYVGNLVYDSGGGGEAKFLLAAGDAQLCQFVVEDTALPTAMNNLGSATGNVSGGSSGVALFPLDAEWNVRAVMSGTGQGGQTICAESGGKVKVMSVTGWSIGILEEDAVDGQYVLFRPYFFKYTSASPGVASGAATP